MILPPRARLLARRSGALLLALALVGGITVWRSAPSVAQSSSEEDAERENLLDIGASTYGRACALCHGEQGRGLDQDGPAGGPSLMGVGAASVDFYLRTGRMPLDNQNARVVRREPQFEEAVIRGLVAYVTSLSDEEGPEIPTLGDLSEADLSEGLSLYTSNCAACHGPTAAGIAVGQNDISSTLDVVEPVQVAEAVRIGPGVMPRFSSDVITDEDLEALTAWVVDLRDRAAPGGASIGRSGPVTEGLVAWVVGMGLLGLVMYLLGQKTGDDEELLAAVEHEEDPSGDA